MRMKSWGSQTKERVVKKKATLWERIVFLFRGI